MNSQVAVFEFGEEPVENFMNKAKEVIETLKIKAKNLNNIK